MISVPLDRAPRFTALSYCWGNAQDKESILLQNVPTSAKPVPTSVTKNLYLALSEIRQTTQVVRLWVDALCINQNDDEEKSWQVQMMRDIYQCADQVLVWLGPSNLETNCAMEYLRRLGDRAASCGLATDHRLAQKQWTKLASMPIDQRDKGMTDDGGRIILTSVDPSTGEEKERFGLSDLNQLYYDISGKHDGRLSFPVGSLAALFSLQYWSRTWVLQEITVAQNVILQCGKKVVRCAHVIAALEALSALRHVIFLTVVMQNIKLSWYESAIAEEAFTPKGHTMLKTRRSFHLKPYSLLFLLRNTCVGEMEIGKRRTSFLDATDPRDKVFGMLGLAADRAALEEKDVIPNYRLSCRDVYATTAAALIELGYASILCYVQSPKTQLGLASWVPDWSVPIKSPLQWHNAEDIAEPGYTASRGCTYQVHIIYRTEKIPTGLSIWGLVYDSVFETGKTYDEISSKPQVMHNTWAREWLDVLGGLSLLPGHENVMDEAQRQEALVRTSTADCSTTSEGYVRMSPQRKLAAVVALFDGQDPALIEESGLGPLLRSIGFTSGITREVLLALEVYQYEGNIGLRARGRVPFITKKGHLGLGPRNLKNGDVVAILAGLDVPFLLRHATDERFELVGETYVDGIMDGEAVGDANSFRMISLV